MNQMNQIPLIPGVGVLISLVLIFSSSTCCLSESSSSSSFIYVGCTQQKYESGYESNLNSVLASLVNSASLSNFNKFKSGQVYGLYQCRGDLSNRECESCVTNAVSRIGTYCVGTCGGALQLEGCFVKYDNTSFIVAQDKSVVWSKCGGGGGGGGGDAAVLDALLIGAGQSYFRSVDEGGKEGIGQCVQDLSMEQCGDCLSEAIRRLRTDCATSDWGDMFLGKCYARFSILSRSPPHQYFSRTEGDDNDETEKTLALIIGLIAGVTLLIVFLSFLSKSLDNKDGR